uniref:AB hydrolase-1 domain-containing protein n=1 Tax=Chromera velia CCMP2878 TaxID=1169474 RepID=A0A0G4I911_9ALVE|eukprot:Cvel_2026.t1-p1 / transcript=Cvel_2026.t1 / gene=Cvel_2026 / organism=Chromera_velia_CCMP2878 / gene_product=Probable lipase C16A3.12c, putative / transcript_product=Probable lipase C16A3.12c, putative / location=Cvel_scaffold77:133417-136167(+) / protein_length=658 / sequence_SO=supercontig / SO=protein_coding / is_pseudo=false
MHRIYNRKNAKPPKDKRVVFIQHGLLESSYNWVAVGWEHSIVRGLIESLGCEVWLGNSRGNFFTSNVSAPSQYNFERMAMYDTKGQLDYVLKYTGVAHVDVIGQSQGGAQTLIALSLSPSLRERVARVVLISAPVVITNLLDSSRSPVLQRLYSGFSKIFAAVLLPVVSVLGIITPAWILAAVLNFLFRHVVGFYLSELPLGGKERIWKANPAGRTSSDNIKFWLQQTKHGDGAPLTREDFAEETNIVTYGQPTAPRYPVENIRCPVHAFYGQRDCLVDVERSLHHLRDCLGQYLSSTVYPHFSHGDLGWGAERHKDFHPILIAWLATPHKLDYPSFFPHSLMYPQAAQKKLAEKARLMRRLTDETDTWTITISGGAGGSESLPPVGLQRRSPSVSSLPAALTGRRAESPAVGSEDKGGAESQASSRKRPLGLPSGRSRPSTRGGSSGAVGVEPKPSPSPTQTGGDASGSTNSGGDTSASPTSAGISRASGGHVGAVRRAPGGGMEERSQFVEAVDLGGRGLGDSEELTETDVNEAVSALPDSPKAGHQRGQTETSMVTASEGEEMGDLRTRLGDHVESSRGVGGVMDNDDVEIFSAASFSMKSSRYFSDAEGPSEKSQPTGRQKQQQHKGKTWGGKGGGGGGMVLRAPPTFHHRASR